jgi:hypothetical protein
MAEAEFLRYLRAQIQQRQGAATRVRIDQALRVADERQQDAVWSAVESHLGIDADEVAARLVIPSGPAQRAKLARRRFVAYREHLEAVVSEAAAGGGAAAAANPVSMATGPGRPIEGHLCGLCRGGCCTQGGDRAYLTAETVRRVMQWQPQWSAADVVQAYLDRVAPHTERGSCINHTKDGCSLPRAMRSDICNDYACGALATLQHMPSNAVGDHPVIVIRRRLGRWTSPANGSENGITALACLTDDGVRRLPATLLSAVTCAQAEETV